MVKKFSKKLSSAQELLDNGQYREAADKYLSILDSFDDVQHIHSYLLRIRLKLCHAYSRVSIYPHAVLSIWGCRLVT